MIQVLDEQGWRDALQAERAVVVCHAEWSIFSVRATNQVEQWEQTWLNSSGLQLSVEVYRVSPESQPNMHGWLTENGLASITLTGAGEVLWLEHGRVVAQMLSYVSKLELIRITNGLWAARTC